MRPVSRIQSLPCPVWSAVPRSDGVTTAAVERPLNEFQQLVCLRIDSRYTDSGQRTRMRTGDTRGGWHLAFVAIPESRSTRGAVEGLSMPDEALKVATVVQNCCAGVGGIAPR
jgi:hypothetical protein